MSKLLPSKAEPTQAQTLRLTTSRLLRLYVSGHLRMFSEKKASEQTALPTYYLLITLLILTKSEANPSNNLMIRRASLSMNGGFHKKNGI